MSSKIRLVLNHSTIVPGLLAILKKITSSPICSKVIRTIIPGRIYKCNKSSNEGPPLEMRLTTSTIDQQNVNRELKQKVLVRHCSQVQEVFFVCKDGQIDAESLAETFKTVVRRQDCTVVIQNRLPAKERITASMRSLSDF